MEDDERQRKVEAGKEKLAAYVRKKQTSNSKIAKKNREPDAPGSNGEFSSPEESNQQFLPTPSSELSLDSDAVEECGHMLSELANIIAIKEDQLKATKDEIFPTSDMLDKGATKPDGATADTMYKLNIDMYDARLKEFQDALRQRDLMIGQMTVSLEESMANREKLNQDVEQLEATVVDLQNKLQQAMQMLNSDTTPALQLITCQNKLSELEDCMKQQLCVIQKLTTEVEQKDNDLERSKLELVMQKAQSSKEVQQLMAEVQRLHQEASTLVAERDDMVSAHAAELERQRAQQEELFGVKLTQLTDEWRQIQAQQQDQLDKQHKHDIELIRATHGEEIVKLRQALLDHSQQSRQADCEEQVQKLQCELQALVSQNSSLSAELEDFRAQMSSWSENKLSLNSELESLRTQLSQSEAEKHQLDELHTEKSNAFIKLTETVQSLESEKQDIESKFTTQINELYNINNENENRILELKNKYLEVEKDNENLIEKLQCIDLEKENLKQELSKVRSIQSKCDLLQAECVGLLSEKKDAECEIAHLYSQVKNLKKEVDTGKTALHKQKTEKVKVEEPACIEFENEVDAAEKGVFSPKRVKLDVPTSPGSIIIWIEKCESLEKELRTAQANILRLETQLQNEQLQAKLLAGEKIVTATKLKELNEKNSSLQKTVGSISRSKKLMNQYEMKIALLENEKCNLSKSLDQLGEELKKSQTVYEEKLHTLQEQLCNGLNSKTNNLEELISESCCKAKELVLLKETLRSHTEKENMLRNKVEFLDKLVEQNEESFRLSQEELQNTQEQLAEFWEKVSERDELVNQREHELAILALKNEQLERQVKALCQPSTSSGAHVELLSLVEELATEVFELKMALAAEKSRSESLSREISPFKTEQKLQHAELIHKLKDQQKTIDEMKAERNVGEWATKLEEQLASMIEEVTMYMNQQTSLTDMQESTSALQETLKIQRGQMERKLQEKAALELQLQQEQNNLRGAKLQIKLTESQLTEKDKKYEELLQQKELLEQELKSMEGCLESKEKLLLDQRLRLETEVRHRDLLIRQCQSEARCREIELVLSQCESPPPQQHQLSVGGEGENSLEAERKLEEMREALDEVHAAAVARLRIYLSEQFDERETELTEEFLRKEAELRQQHSEQVTQLQCSMAEKEQASRGDSHLEILTQLGLTPCTDTAQVRAHLQEKLKQDLTLLQQNLPMSESTIFTMLEEKFHQFAQQQVLLSVAKLREDCEASFAREISSLNMAHSEQLMALKTKLDYEREKEIRGVKQELGKQHKENVNMLAVHTSALLKVDMLLKQDKDEHNRTILHQLERSTHHQYTEAIKSFSKSWTQKCRSELECITRQIHMSCDAGGDADSDNFDKLAILQEKLLKCAQEARKQLWEKHALEVDKLQAAMQSRHKALQDAVIQAQEKESLQQQVQLLVRERDSLLEQRREVERLQKVIGEFEASSRGVGDLLKLKEEQHKKEMDEVRTYFQQKCSDMEKQYTEKVLSQHSRNSSSSCSENELNSSEILCADGEHASRLASITRMCETYSDIPSYSDLDEQFKVDFERRLSACKDELEGAKQDLEVKYQREMKNLKSEHEEQIRDLVRDLQKGHEDELNESIKSHEAEISTLQTLHEDILAKLQVSHQSMLEQQLEQMRCEMSVTENRKLLELRSELERSHSLEIETIRSSFVGVTEVTMASKESEGESDYRNKSSHKMLREKMREALRVEFDVELQAKLQEQSEIIAKQVDEIAASMKKDAEREQTKLVSAHQQTVAECLEQQRQQLEALKARYDASLVDVRAKLRALHEDELRAAEERHRRSNETMRTHMYEEVVREHKRKTEELMEQIKTSYKSELMSAETRLKDSHKKEVDQLRTSLEQQEASYVRLLEETRSVHARELAELSENCKQRLHEAVEQSKHELVKTLGEQIQALLAQEPGTESWPPELQQLQERLCSETHHQLAEAQAQHDEHIRMLHETHQQELSCLHANQKLLEESNDWKLESKVLRTFVTELFQYLITIDEELNNQSRFSDTESIASAEMSQNTETESTASSETGRKRVRFTPNLDMITSLMSDETLRDSGSSVLEDLRAELDKCLVRVRRDVTDLLGISEASLIAQRLPRDAEQLRAKLLASEQKREVVEAELQALRDRVAELERKKREVINEGYGEGVEEHPNLEKRLERLSEVQDRARSVLLSNDPDDPGPPHLLHLIEELCREGDLLTEEARRDKEDLQLQVEAADKQLKSTRSFLEEQATERELERDEFSRELVQLQESLKERERDRLECTRLAKEVKCEADPCTTPAPNEADNNIEVLETQAKETTQLLQEAESKSEELNGDLKASSDKISVLRDVIHDLETQLEQKVAAENELRKHLVSLQLALDEESHNHSELASQLDSLRLDTSNADLTDHIAVLEEQILAYTQQLDHLKNSSPGVREMKSQLRNMEASLDKRTKELERLHNASMSTCSSPSEDVSIREQLEASRAAVGSPENSGRTSPISLRRLQEKMQQHSRAEEAAFKRIRDLEMQLTSLKQSEEEVHAERDALQQRVEEQLLQISSLQATLDQQRLQQSVIEARDATQTRRQLQAAAERLDQARDLLQAKDTEIGELRSQLEKTKKVIVAQEEEFTKKNKDADEEIGHLQLQLEELQKEKDSLENAVDEASSLRATPRVNSRLLDSLLAEKNAEIDELGLQVTLLRERLELISSRLSSDVTKDDIMDLMREVRTSHGELQSHCSALHKTLQSAASRSNNSDMEVMREAAQDSGDFLNQNTNLGLTFNESVLQNIETSQPIPPAIAAPVTEVSEVEMHEEMAATPQPPPLDSLAEFSALEDEVASTKKTLADKQAEVTQLKLKLKECTEKINEDMRRLQEENSHLKTELTAVTGRLEEYAQLMQSEMEQSASLDQSLLQASSILLGNERENIETSENPDLSLHSENLQRLLTRVQKGGFEVLSLSEVALLHRHTRGLLQTQTVATQTSRSGFSDARQVADLQQQLTTLEQATASKEMKIAKKVESLEAALSREKMTNSEVSSCLDKEQQNLLEARKMLASQAAELKQLRESNAEMTTLLAAEQQSTAEARRTQETQVAEMQQLREKAEEVQLRVSQQDHNTNQLRLELDKERLRAAALESSLAAEEINTYKHRAHYEGECVRHRATMSRNAALTELLDSKITQAQETENSLRKSLEEEQNLRRSLQTQLNALQKCKDSGSLDALNQQLKSSLEKEHEQNAELMKRLNEHIEKTSVELQACEALERKRADIEIAAERDTSQAIKQSLEQVQQQLQSTLSQVQSERETNTKLICHIQELESQLSNVKEDLRHAESCSEREKTEHERQQNKLEVALKHLYDRKNNAQKESEQLKKQLDAVTQKWEEQLTREKMKAEAMCELQGNGDIGEIHRMRVRLQELEGKLVKAQAQGSQLSAERRAWASEKASLMSQIMKLEHQTQVAKSMLATERANWLLEKGRILNDSSRCASPHSDNSDIVLEGKLQYLFGKCQRSESYRKALVWQKRYLLLVLRGYQATQDRLKQHLLLVNGPRHSHLLTESKPTSPLQKFKAAVLVVVAVHRMQFVVKKRLQAFNIGSSVILKRMTDALLMSPEPRLDPPSTTFNGQSESSSFSPPTRDSIRNNTLGHSSSAPRLHIPDSPISRRVLDMNEYRLRSDFLQQRLGLINKGSSKK